MKLVRSPRAMASLAARWRARGLSVGFVPTMGALHAAHRSLLRRARRENDRLVVSVFVNPAQFGPKEDFARYPRPFRRDAAACRAERTDALYHPAPGAIYPPGYGSFVEVPGLGAPLCGRFRPGHFRGVATVVLKLLESVRPDRLYLGEKDYQQLLVLRRMARDLGLPVRVVGCPTIRASDGLALSSRNAYLSPEERARAPRLYGALRAGAAEAKRRGATPASVRRRMRRALGIPGARVDYLEIVDAESLARPARLKGKLRLLGAVRIGNTRLIDNLGLLV